MRNFLSRIFENVAFSEPLFWVTIFFGTILFTVALCNYFNVPVFSLPGLLIEFVSFILAFVVCVVISLIFSVISDWLK